MFTVNGELKGAADQKVFLEQISFNQQPPQILDTAEVIKGNFKVKAVAPEEGLYRLGSKKMPDTFLLMINRILILVAM